MSGLTTLARAPEGFRDRWSTVDGLRLHALESTTTSSRPAVILPGLVTASRSMVPLARALAGHDIRALILDPPGFGYSAKPPRALSAREQAGLVAAWMDEIGVRPALMLGNSFGCQLAAAVAAGHPGMVSRLVLVSPTVAPKLRRRLSWLRMLPNGPGAPGRLGGRLRIRALVRLHRVLGDDPPLRLLNVTEYMFGSLPRAVSTLRHAVVDPIEDDLRHVAAPTLLIRGDDDRLSSAEWVSRLAQVMPDGRPARLPGLGHDAFSRDPGAVAALAAAFLAASG